MAVGELRLGENLLLADETTRCIGSLTRRENRETVYNIAVDGEHVFYVGDGGVLVHNTWNTVVIRQNIPWRVGPAARALGARTISVRIALTWTAGENSSWIGRVISNVTNKRGPICRILDIGDQAGEVTISGRGFYANEVRILREHGWVQLPTNLTVTINGVVTPVFEWIRP